MSAAPVMQKAPPPFRPLLFCGSSFAFLLPPILSFELDFWSMFRHRAQSFCTGTRPSSISLQSWQGENNFVIWLPGQDESKADGSNLYHLTGLMTFVYAVFVWWFLLICDCRNSCSEFGIFGCYGGSTTPELFERHVGTSFFCIDQVCHTWVLCCRDSKTQEVPVELQSQRFFWRGQVDLMDLFDFQSLKVWQDCRWKGRNSSCRTGPWF